MMINKFSRWRRSSHCSPSNCVEISPVGEIRDSKNPSGPVLRVDLAALVSVIKSGAYDA